MNARKPGTPIFDAIGAVLIFVITAVRALALSPSTRIADDAAGALERAQALRLPSLWKICRSWRIGVCGVLLLFSSQGQTQQFRQQLSRHVRPQISWGRAQPAGALPPSQRLDLSLVLPLRNPDKLAGLLRRLYDPASPDYRHFLSVAEFTEQFGTPAEDYQAVVDFARTNGFTVTGTPANRMVVPISGTVAQIEKAFHVAMKTYRHPTEDREFFSPDREPSLDLSQMVAHIAGLNNYSLPRSNAIRPPARQPLAITPVEGSGPGGSYLSSDMRAAYYGAGALTGSGQTVGLVQFDGYNISDVTATFDGTATATTNGSNYVLQYSPTNGGGPYTIAINNVLLDGVNGGPNSGDDAEEVLDIVQAVGMAPGLSQVRVYIGNSDVDILNAIATENIAKQLSISWTWCPDDPSTDDIFFEEFAVQGQSAFAASGDYGAYSPDFPSYYPAEDAWVTAVGATRLTTYAAGGAISSETAWNRSGGGSSPDGIAIPTWQAGIPNSSNGGSTTLRNVPDVAMEGDFDNYDCDMGSCSGDWAGTSFASPRWAGFMALVNQQASANGDPAAGFMNPGITAAGLGSSYGSEFHDIVTGNNGYDSGYAFSAVTGYDLVTGWGSPAGQNLIDAMAPAASVGFQLSSTANLLTLNPGSSGSTTVTVSNKGGFTGSVNLAVTSTLPGGVTASFGTNPTTGTSVLTLTASISTPSGSYLIVVTGTSGNLSAVTDVVVNTPLSAVTILNPAPPLATGTAQILKPGTLIPIRVTVLGNFTNFQVEWAPGINPASGWTAAGVTLSAGMSAPAVNQTVGTWDTSSIVSAGFYTICLSVTYPAVTIASHTLVYLEPSLLSSNWPMWMSDVPTFASGVVPLTGSAAEPLLAWAGNRVSAGLWLSSPDGSMVTTVPLNGYAGLYNPASGSLDALPGDDVLTGVGHSIDIFQAHGTPYTAFDGLVTNSGISFFDSQVVLDDVDGDSLPETLAIERGGPNQTAYLHVWRRNGRELNASFPISITDQNPQILTAVPRVLSGDVDGDGNKEMVAIEGTTSTSFTPLLFGADGRKRTWSPPALNGAPLQILLADLDHNGKLESVLVVNDPNRDYLMVHVLQPDGLERPGWPVPLMSPSTTGFAFAYLAVGDLSGNGTEQIVVSDGFGLFVFNADGGTFSSAWPYVRTPDFATGSRFVPGPVVLADVNGDGLPEILTTFWTAILSPLKSAVNSTPATPASSPVVYRIGPGGAQVVADFGAPTSDVAAFTPFELQTQLYSIDRNGNALKSWNLLGANGQEPCDNGVITVGDFNQDGTTDIAVSYLTVSQQIGNYYLCLGPGIVTVLGTGSPSNSSANDWPMLNQNPRNTAVLRRVQAATLAIVPSVKQWVAGQQVSFTAVVAPGPSANGTPSGVVNLIDSGQNIGACQLSSGTCKIDTTFAAGAHTVVAGYAGSGVFGSTTSNVVSAVVDQPGNNITTVLSAFPSSVTLGGTTTLTASVSSTLSGSVSGTVTFLAGSTSLGSAALSGGVATLGNVAVTAANGLGGATDTITAIYGTGPGSTPSIGATTIAVAIPPAAATPTFSPAPGTYTTTQTVTISDSTAGATIYYTTNGIAPTVNSSVYSGAIAVAASETIQAIATATGYSSSAVATATYIITPPAATPTFSPAPGTYTTTQAVTISDSTPGATIYYTTNGIAPTVNSSVYSGALAVAASETIEAIATANGYSTSGLATAAYIITPPAATPTFSPAPGTYTTTQTVTISDSTAGATIYYTTNGIAPTVNSSVYSGAIAVAASETIQASATATGYSSSAVATATYIITPPAATPTFSPAPGTYTTTQTVTISDSTPGATIYYTTNGIAPTVNSSVYSGAIAVAASETIEAIATANGYSTSGTASASYTLRPPNPCALNHDGDIGPTIMDVQLIVNEALGVAPAVNDLNGDGVVNVTAVQKEVNATLGLGCAAN